MAISERLKPPANLRITAHLGVSVLITTRINSKRNFDAKIKSRLPLQTMQPECYRFQLAVHCSGRNEYRSSNNTRCSLRNACVVEEKEWSPAATAVVDAAEDFPKEKAFIQATIVFIQAGKPLSFFPFKGIAQPL